MPMELTLIDFHVPGAGHERAFSAMTCIDCDMLHLKASNASPVIAEMLVSSWYNEFLVIYGKFTFCLFWSISWKPLMLGDNRQEKKSVHSCANVGDSYGGFAVRKVLH